MTELLKLLNVDPTSQAMILLISMFFGAIWWVYSRGLNNVRVRNKQLQDLIDQLYSPGLGLLLALKSQRLEESAFKTRFLDLALNHRAKASSELSRALTSWIEGFNNETELQARFEAALTDACGKLDHSPTAVGLWVLLWLGQTIGYLIMFGGFFISVVMLLIPLITHWTSVTQWVGNIPTPVLRVSLVFIVIGILGLVIGWFFLVENLKERKVKNIMHRIEGEKAKAISDHSFTAKVDPSPVAEVAVTLESAGTQMHSKPSRADS